MKKIGDIIIDIKRYVKGQPTSKRAYWVQQLADLVGVSFKKMFGFTSRMTVEEIQEIYDTSKGWKTNPPALARKLIKETNQKINKQLWKITQQKL